MHLWQQMGWLARITLLVDVVPLIMAVLYAIRPTERRLALMRPLSLAGLFGGLAGTIGGFGAVLRGVGVTQEITAVARQRIALGTSETLVPLFVGLSCLTAAWLLVAVGMRRGDAER